MQKSVYTLFIGILIHCNVICQIGLEVPIDVLEGKNMKVQDESIVARFPNAEMIFIFFLKKDSKTREQEHARINSKFLPLKSSGIEYLIYEYIEGNSSSGPEFLKNMVISDTRYFVRCKSLELCKLITGETNALNQSSQIREFSIDNCKKDAVSRLDEIYPKYEAVISIFKEEYMAIKTVNLLTDLQNQVNILTRKMDSLNKAVLKGKEQPPPIPLAQLSFGASYSMAPSKEMVQATSDLAMKLQSRRGSAIEVGYRIMTSPASEQAQGLGIAFNWFRNDLSVLADSSFFAYSTEDADGNVYQRRVYGRQLSEHMSISGMAIQLGYFRDFPVGLESDWVISIETGLSFFYLSSIRGRYAEGIISTRGKYAEISDELMNIPEYGFQENVPITNTKYYDLNARRAGVSWYGNIALNRRLLERVFLNAKFGLLVSPNLTDSNYDDSGNYSDNKSTFYGMDLLRLNPFSIGLGLTFKL